MKLRPAKTPLLLKRQLLQLLEGDEELGLWLRKKVSQQFQGN